MSSHKLSHPPCSLQRHKQAPSNRIPPDAPVDSHLKNARQVLNTQIGSPIDTKGEWDAQRNNLGPKDTPLEATTTSEHGHDYTPKPRPK